MNRNKENNDLGRVKYKKAETGVPAKPPLKVPRALGAPMAGTPQHRFPLSLPSVGLRHPTGAWILFSSISYVHQLPIFFSEMNSWIIDMVPNWSFQTWWVLPNPKQLFSHNLSRALPSPYSPTPSPHPPQTVGQQQKRSRKETGFVRHDPAQVHQPQALIAPEISVQFLLLHFSVNNFKVASTQICIFPPDLKV